MTHQPLVPTDKANQVVGSVLSGSSNHEAAHIHGIKPQTADRIVKKYYETGSVAQRPGSGRKPIVTAWMQRHVIDLAKKNCHMKFKDIGKQLNPKISASSVRRILKEAGFAKRKARKVIYLTEEQKEKRVEWARKFEDWGSEDWARVIWSDEVYVVLGDWKGSVFVTRNLQEEFHEDCVIPKFKQSNLRIMAWSCIMKGKKGPLVVLDYLGGRGGGMTAARYQEQVLEKVVHDFYQEASEERGWVLFEQDGAPSHTAKSTIKWLERNLVETMPQPAGSPDVVPIEALWHTLKEIICACSHIPTTLDKLKIAVSEAWDEIPLEEVDKHIATMNKRVQAVMAANGGHTKY
jgi:transposase